MSDEELPLPGSSMAGDELPPPPPTATVSLPMIGVCCKMSEGGEAVISEVFEETPAAFSGQVSIGNVVEAVNGERISSLEELKSLVDGNANTLVMIELRRQGQAAVESLHLMRLATKEDQSRSPKGSLKVGETPKAGMGARVVHDDRGMKVCAMYEGSSAYWSKLKIGDLICAVDGHDIRRGPPSRVLALTSGDVGTSMTLLVIRKHDPTEEPPLGAVPVDNVPGSARSIWPGEDIPVLRPGEMLVQICVVRLQTLNGAALKRALSYRSQVVELLQKHIEDALKDTQSFGTLSPTHISWAGSNARKAETPRERIPSPHAPATVMARPSASHTLGARPHTSPRTPVPSFSAVTQPAMRSPVGNVSAAGKAQRDQEEAEKIVLEIQTRMEEHQRLLHEEALSLQGQIREVAGMLQAQGRTSLSKEDSLAAFEQQVLGYIQALQRRQEHEKRDTLTLLQRHTQETWNQQQRLGEEMLRQRDRQQQQRAESMALHESLRQLLTPGPDVVRGQLTAKLTSLEAAQGIIAPVSLPLTPPISDRPHAGPPRLAGPDTPVGVSIAISADYERVQPHEGRFSQDLLTACAFCLQASPARFLYCGMRQGSVIAILDVLPDRSGSDPRTCRMLAGELASQVAHPHSPLRNTPVTKPATKVTLHEPTGGPGKFTASGNLNGAGPGPGGGHPLAGQRISLPQATQHLRGHLAMLRC